MLKTSNHSMRMKRSVTSLTSALLTLALFVAVATALPLILQAQSFYGSVVGTVTDSSGAVVPGANVTVTNTGTNIASKVQTDAGGCSLESQVLPGGPPEHEGKADCDHPGPPFVAARASKRDGSSRRRWRIF